MSVSPSQRIARRDASANIFYYAEDFLGSSRTIVQAGQTSSCYDADFYPYGGERAYTNTCAQHYKFMSHERDAESGLDDFGALLRVVRGALLPLAHGLVERIGSHWSGRASPRVAVLAA